MITRSATPAEERRREVWPDRAGGAGMKAYSLDGIDDLFGTWGAGRVLDLLANRALPVKLAGSGHAQSAESRHQIEPVGVPR